MKITISLPQFEDESALLVVCGKQVAKIYIARNGEVNERDGFQIENPQFSDRESFYQSSGRGQVFSSGSVYEDQDEHVIKEFALRLAEHLHLRIKDHKPDCIYMFMPEPLKSTIKLHLSVPEKELIKEEFYGNYTDFHPFTLLKMVKEREDIALAKKRPPQITKRASKILKKKEILDDSTPTP